MNFEHLLFPVKGRHSKERKLFTEEEDQILKQLSTLEIENKWAFISSKLKGRTPRQCRDRYNHYLSPELKKDEWLKEEDDQLINLVQQYGTRWSYLSSFFDGRSPNHIKNRWYKHIMKPSKKDPIFKNNDFNGEKIDIDNYYIESKMNLNDQTLFTIFNIFTDEKTDINWC